MASRLGDVLHWAACLLALAIVAFSSLYAYTQVSPTGYLGYPEMGGIWIFNLSIAVVIWFIGRAAKYALAGR